MILLNPARDVSEIAMLVALGCLQIAESKLPFLGQTPGT